MTDHLVDAIHTVELAAWDFDCYQFRPRSLDSRKIGEAREFVLHRPQDLSSRKSLTKGGWSERRITSEKNCGRTAPSSSRVRA